MKITVSGTPIEPELGDEILRRAQLLREDPRLAGRPGSLDESLLGDVHDPAAFDRAFMELLRTRTVLDTRPFVIPRKPGVIGSMMSCVRAFLWRLLRYQHDRMAAWQTRINGWIVSALEHRTADLKDEVSMLRRRIEILERDCGESGRDRDPGADR